MICHKQSALEMWATSPVQEMSENLEVFREVWSMHLSATRNRIIRINLIVTVASFALTACIVPASFFGMNLPSGLGEVISASLGPATGLAWFERHCGPMCQYSTCYGCVPNCIVTSEPRDISEAHRESLLPA